MKRARPRRTQYSRAEASLGAVRERDAGNGQLVRMVKVRMDGPPGRRWIPYARWWWEQHRGPVPPGKRIAHADGNLLNDDPGNLFALTPGEVIQLYHRLDPEMSRRSHAACGAAAAKRNAEVGRIRRATSWLPAQWYAVDFERREIHNRPRRKRWMVYADHGFAERLAAHLLSRVAAARAGDTRSAAYVLEQAARLEQYWRWIRSSSLGWPHLNCMQSCILCALADAGGTLKTFQLMDTVTTMRRLFDWTPHQLQRGVLYSCVSALGTWIRTARMNNTSRHTITAEALAARVPCPRIVPIRGRVLTAEPTFASFTRVGPDAPATNRESYPTKGAA